LLYTAPGENAEWLRSLSTAFWLAKHVALNWALAGCGLVMNSWVDVKDHLRSSRLVHVLPEWRSESAPVCALFPSSRQLPTRVRVFIDAMVDSLARIAS